MPGEVNIGPEPAEAQIHAIPIAEVVDFYNGQATELEREQHQLCAEMALSTGDHLTVAEKLSMARLEGRLSEVQALHAFLHSQNADHDLLDIGAIQISIE